MIDEIPRFGNDVENKLVGKVDFSVISSLHEMGLADYLRRIDYMPHDEVIRCQRQSQVLLLIINNTPNAKMILTGKFFEYLASRRPVLCLGPVDGDAAFIMKETNAGLISGFQDMETMKQNILQYYSLFKDGKLVSENNKIKQYSRETLTGHLAALLDRISS